jgi:NMD protein affecting ribosome stability and mRNA decay
MINIEVSVIKKDKNTYRAIVKIGASKTYIDYDRNKVLEVMEEEDIKGQGYVDKFYEADIKERIETDVADKMERYLRENAKGELNV